METIFVGIHARFGCFFKYLSHPLFILYASLYRCVVVLVVIVVLVVVVVVVVVFVVVVVVVVVTAEKGKPVISPAEPPPSNFVHSYFPPSDEETSWLSGGEVELQNKFLER